MKRVNLGCGLTPVAGWVNVDRVQLPGTDVVHDLDDAPWPFDDASVDEIRGDDVFEHVANALVFMNECGRILRTGGVLRLRTCYWRSENAFTDPTHKRFCTERTFDYWIRGTEFNLKYGEAYAARGTVFEKVRIALEGSELSVTLRRIR